MRLQRGDWPRCRLVMHTTTLRDNDRLLRCFRLTFPRMTPPNWEVPCDGITTAARSRTIGMRTLASLFHCHTRLWVPPCAPRQPTSHATLGTHGETPSQPQSSTDVNTALNSTGVEIKLAHGLVSSRASASPSPHCLNCGFCVASLTVNQGNGGAAARQSISKAEDA